MSEGESGGWSAGGSKRRRPRWLAVLAVLLAAALAGGIAFALAGRTGNRSATSSTTSSTTGTPASGAKHITYHLGGVVWHDPGVQVLVGPVASHGVVLFTTVAPDRSINLEGIDPATGKTLWTRPFSPATITPGVPLMPAAIDGIALDLTPIGGEGSGRAAPSGIDVRTGRTLWQDSTMQVNDTPIACSTGHDFCIDGAQAGPGSRTTSGVFALDAQSGSLVRFQPGPERWLGGNLYQDSNSSMLDGIGPDGRLEWTRSTASIFGGAAYDPDYGWDIQRFGSVDVGYVGMKPQHNTYDMSLLKTVGIDMATGRTLWSQPGMYACGGAVTISTPFLCRLSVVLHRYHIPKTMPGVLARLDPATGKLQWSVQVSNTAQLAHGMVRINGTESLTGNFRAGGPQTLDLSTGQLTQPTAGEVGWCVGKFRMLPVQPVANYRHTSRRVGVSGAVPCTISSGRPATTAPGQPWLGGTVSGGVFVWPLPQGGIEAVRATASAGA